MCGGGIVLNLATTFCSNREPSCLPELLASLQAKWDVKLAVSEEEWATLPRTNVTVSRERVLEGALRMVRRRRFDGTKLLNVSSSSKT